MYAKTLFSSLAAAVIAFSQPASAAVISTNRAIFSTDLAAYFVDDYENVGYSHGDRIDTNYLDGFSNEAMSAVRGETRYATTGFDDLNLIVGTSNHSYCAGCNGSFLLDFTQNSFSSLSGVNAIGFDFAKSTNYVANIKFADGTFDNFNIGTGSGFWGITSDLAISSLHLGLLNGGSTINGYVEIDNLTTGMTKAKPVSVAEPGPWALFCAGILGLLVTRRKQTSAK